MRGLLRATPGVGAVLVVERASVSLMSLALRAGVDDAIELSQVGPQLAGVLSELASRLEDELGIWTRHYHDPKTPLRHVPGQVMAYRGPEHPGLRLPGLLEGRADRLVACFV